MTTEQIELVLQEEKNKFNETPYVGKVPKDILTMFKKIMFKMTTAEIKLPMAYLNDVTKKNIGDLTNADIANISNFIFMSPIKWDAIYETPEKAISKNLEFENLRHAFNEKFRKFQEAMDNKRVLMAGPSPRSLNHVN